MMSTARRCWGALLLWILCGAWVSVEAINLSVSFMRACELEGLPESVRDAAANCILSWPQALPFLAHVEQERAHYKTGRFTKAPPPSPSVADVFALSGHTLSDFSSFFDHFEKLVLLAFENVDLLFPTAESSPSNTLSPLGEALNNIFDIPGFDPQRRQVSWTWEQVSSPNIVGKEALQVKVDHEIVVCKFNVLGWIFGDLKMFAFYNTPGDFANLQVAANMLYELYRLQVPLLVLETFSHQMAMFGDSPTLLRLILSTLGQIASDASVLFREAFQRLASHIKLFHQDIRLAILDEPAFEDSLPLLRLIRAVRMIPLQVLTKSCLKFSLHDSSAATRFIEQLSSFYLIANVEMSRFRIRYAHYAISEAQEMGWGSMHSFKSSLCNARLPNLNYRFDLPSKLREMLDLIRSDHDGSALNSLVESVGFIEVRNALRVFIEYLHRAVAMMGPEVMHIVRVHKSTPNFTDSHPAELQVLEILHDLMLPYCQALTEIAQFVSPEAWSLCPVASKVWVLLFEARMTDLLVLAKLVKMMMRDSSKKECKLTIICDDFPDASFVESHWSSKSSRHVSKMHQFSEEEDEDDVGMFDIFNDSSSSAEDDASWEKLVAELEEGGQTRDVQAAESVSGKKRSSLPSSPAADTNYGPPTKISKCDEQQSSWDQREQP